MKREEALAEYSEIMARPMAATKDRRKGLRLLPPDVGADPLIGDSATKFKKLPDCSTEENAGPRLVRWPLRRDVRDLREGRIQ